MFYIKSDDIDELFREAAQKYHVDTEKAEAWEDVQAAVHADDAPPLPGHGGNGKKRRWLVFVWLLLIPLGWFAHNIWWALTTESSKPRPAQTVSAGRKKEGGNGKNQAGDNNKVGNYNQAVDGNRAGTDAQKAVATVAGQIKPGIIEKPTVNVSSTQSVKQGTAFINVKPAAVGISVNTGPGKSAGSGLIGGSTGKVTNGTMPNIAGVASAMPGQNNEEDKTGASTATQGVPNDEKIVPGNNINSLNGVIADTANKSTEPQVGISKSGGKKAGKERSRKSHYFYAGLTAAPDISFIRLQKTSTIGTGAGVLLGYQFAKNFAVESGALLEKKFYYSDGEYFDVSNVPYFVTNNIHPETVTGNCNMVEIPLNIKYTLKTKRAGSFYVIGGMSSYLMGHEAYTFNYKDWGVEHNSTWSYNIKRGYWFSIFNLGAGYQRALGSKTNLRVEPYAKLPLSGLGTGGLKITSAGLYLTLTRKFP